MDPAGMKTTDRAIARQHLRGDIGIKSVQPDTHRDGSFEIMSDIP